MIQYMEPAQQGGVPVSRSTVIRFLVDGAKGDPKSRGLVRRIRGSGRESPEGHSRKRGSSHGRVASTVLTPVTVPVTRLQAAKQKLPQTATTAAPRFGKCPSR